MGWLNRYRTRTYRLAAKRAVSKLPTLESLEDRQLLSTCHVTRLSDGGAGFGFRGDLRYCINKVNSEPGPDAIDFHANGTINLTGALPNLSTDIDIQGPGADLLTVRRDTGGSYRIFTVRNGATVQIEGVTISNGSHEDRDGFGGGIYNAGMLTVLRSVITGNLASSTSIHTGNGGGIYNAKTGNLTVIESSITNNTVATFNNVSYGAGICNDGFASIYSSTISGNKGGIDTFLGGAGISNWCWYFGPGGVMVLHNSTVSGNEGDSPVYTKGPLTVISHSTISDNESARGIHIDPDSSVFMSNTIVSGNNGFASGDVFGALASSDYNLIGDSEGGSGYGPNDMLDVDSMLGALADNGGPTLTMELLPGSPAIDAGDNTNAPEFDQRGPGFPRIVNGTIDIGAFEVQSTGAPSQPHSLAFLITAESTQDEQESIR